MVRLGLPDCRFQRVSRYGAIKEIIIDISHERARETEKEREMCMARKRIGNFRFRFQPRRRDDLLQVAEIKDVHHQAGHRLSRARHLFDETLERHQAERTSDLPSVHREGTRQVFSLGGGGGMNLRVFA